MKGLTIRLNGDYLAHTHSIEQGNCARQMISVQGMEMVFYSMPQGVEGGFQELECPGETEAYYILSGRIRLLPQGETEITLGPGDVFYFNENETLLPFHVLDPLQMILFSNESRFEQDAETNRALLDVMEALQEIDGDTRMHCDRVRNLAMRIAREMNYPASGLHDLFFAARFHDVGKCKVPKEILIKPARLDEKEYEMMKEHAAISAEMVRPVFGDEIARIVKEHHERPDGKGYPAGLTATQIHPAAAIIAVADSYDAMVTVRPYNKGKTPTEAAVELRRCAGVQFDDKCVEALCCYLQRKGLIKREGRGNA